MQQNIHVFGGDSNSVTILGQSSGGTSILALLASPASASLFHAAVSLSASPNITVSIDDEQVVFADAVIAANTSCSGAGAGAGAGAGNIDAACLRKLPASTVASFLPRAFDVSPGLPSGPSGMQYPGLIVVDGVTVTSDPEDALSRGLIDVPLLLQTELAEMDTYENNATINNMTAAQYGDFITSWFASHGFNVTAATPTPGDVLRELYAAELATSVELAHQVFVAEYSFLCGNIALARLAAQGFKSPVYVLTWRDES